MNRSTTVKLAIGACVLVPLANCGSQLANSGTAGTPGSAGSLAIAASTTGHAEQPRADPDGCSDWTVSFSACVDDRELVSAAAALCNERSSDLRAMEYPSRCDVERSLKTVFACCPRPARQAYTVDPTLIFDAGPASASDFHVRYADFASVPDGSVRRRVRRRISGVSDASFAPDVSLYAADGASGRPFPAVPTPVPTAALDHDAWLRPDAAAGRDSGVRPRVPGRIGRGHVDAGAPYTAPEPDCREQSILFDQCVDSVAVLNFAYAQCKSQGLGLPPTRSTAELACGVARFHCCPLADDGGVSRLP